MQTIRDEAMELRYWLMDNYPLIFEEFEEVNAE